MASATTAADYLSITETPGTLLNREQLGRMVLRYSLAAELGTRRRVLEVSCGAGIGFGLLASSADWFTACDYSKGGLALAQEAASRHVPLAVADAQALPYASASFELLVSFEAIYYLARPDIFIGESRRLLAPGGQLLLGASNPDWPYFAPGMLSAHYPSAVELAALVAAAGFAQVRLYGSLPADTAGSMAGSLRARLRQALLRSGMFSRDNVLTRVLKRASYGTLEALPVTLSETTRVAHPFTQLTPIATDRVDRRHRVLFVVAESPEDALPGTPVGTWPP